MEDKRYEEWMKNSEGIIYMEMLLVNRAQGLGLLDIELIEEYHKIDFKSSLEKELLKKLRYITLSELWVMGAYELIMVISDITSKKKDKIDVGIIDKIKETLKLFLEVRIPLTKFKKSGQDRLFSGVPTKCEFDEKKGLGWKIVSSYKKKFETKIFYRKDLADSLLEMFKTITRDIRAREKSARN